MGGKRKGEKKFMAPSGFSTALATLSLLLVLIHQASAYVVQCDFAGHAGNGLLINTYFNGSSWLL